MPLCFITEDVTREGIMTIKEAPERAKGVVAFASSFNVEIIEFFYCMGNFDFIMKVVTPVDESVNAFVMVVRKTGNVTAKATRAFNPEEWADIVNRLPD